jgi:cell division transport system permease protein
MNANYFANMLDQKIEIKIDLLDKVTNYDEIKNKLMAMNEVRDVTFVSKDEAFKKVAKDMGKDSDILNVLDENPFPARFVVKVKNPGQLKEVVAQINSWKIAENVQYGEEYVEKMLMLTKFVRNAGYVVTGLAALFAIFVLISTIRVNIVQRRNEIRVKQLIGASNFTIRFPFILEAILLTGVSSAIVYYLFVFGYGRLVTAIKGAIPYAPLMDSPIVLNSILFPLLIMALIIAFIGSTFSVKRFLKKV